MSQSLQPDDHREWVLSRVKQAIEKLRSRATAEVFDIPDPNGILVKARLPNDETRQLRIWEMEVKLNHGQVAEQRIASFVRLFRVTVMEIASYETHGAQCPVCGTAIPARSGPDAGRKGRGEPQRYAPMCSGCRNIITIRSSELVVPDGLSDDA